MKKYSFISLLFSIAAYAAQSQTGGSFLLKGHIVGQNTGKVYLYYNDNKNDRVKDSAVLKNGSFLFKGNLAEPAEAWFVSTVKIADMQELNTTHFFLEPAVMNIELRANDFRHAKVNGSKTQNESAKLEKMKAPVYKEMEPMEKEYAAASKAYREAIKNKTAEAALDSMKEKLAVMHDAFDPFQQRIAAINYRFFAGNPNSYVTASNLRFYVSSLPLDSLIMFYNNMNTALQQSYYGKNLATEIEKLQGGSPGSTAKNFTATDINGNKLSLSDFKGKYVLVDFWASWCVPCRHGNPHLIELYRQYHDKGLDIIGVSDDDHDHEAWKKAVAKDQIDIWHHVLRGLDMDKIRKNQPNENDISEKFGIHSLPTKILIDKNGIIVGRYDKGTDEEKEDMDKKIASLLNN